MNQVQPRALIVEDDDAWQEIVSEILADAGMAVDVARHVHEALALLKMYPHRLSVVDLSLASDDPHNEDGLRVLDAIREHDPGCRVVLLTGFATVELAVSALTTYGAFMFLRKERFNRESFNELIQRALADAPQRPARTEPRTDAPVPVIAPPHEQDAGVALVVDDDVGWQSLLADLLDEGGYKVQVCGSFGAALSYLRRRMFTLAVVDLALSDALPGVQPMGPVDGLEGYHLLTCTRAEHVPTIVVSGIAAPASIQQTYAEQGIFAYVEKQTFDRDTFLRLVAEVGTLRQRTNKLEALTDREREVLNLLAQGLTNKEIANLLVITPHTVKRHLKAIFEKLDVHTRSAAAVKATEGIR